MVNTIAFLLIVFGIMFLIGIAMAILALYFNIKMKHPIFSIIFSIILIPLICIPIQFTGGILISRCMLIIALIYKCGNDCNGGEKYQRQLLNMHSLCECPH